jgi:hypothetical protein
MAGFSGGCLCGAIRYEVKSDPVRTANCHCDNCRRSSGAAFATNVFVKEDDLVVLQGAPKSFQHPTDSGNTMTKQFCGDCGAPLFGWGSGGQGFRSVRVGSIDDASFVRPMIDVFVSKALPYTILSDDTEHFERGRPPQ